MKHTHTSAFVMLSAALLFVLAPTGCDKKKPVAVINLAQVKAVGEFESMAAANRICREMDVHYKGATKTITLTFDNNAITDDAGHIYDVLPEEFKGVVNMAQTAPGKVAAAHALPPTPRTTTTVTAPPNATAMQSIPPTAQPSSASPSSNRLRTTRMDKATPPRHRDNTVPA